MGRHPIWKPEKKRKADRAPQPQKTQGGGGGDNGTPRPRVH